MSFSSLSSPTSFQPSIPFNPPSLITHQNKFHFQPHKVISQPPKSTVFSIPFNRVLSVCPLQPTACKIAPPSIPFTVTTYCRFLIIAHPFQPHSPPPHLFNPCDNIFLFHFSKSPSPAMANLINTRQQITSRQHLSRWCLAVGSDYR